MATKLVATRLPPRLGAKQIFLPNFTLTLLRPPPGTPPTFASFIVPLNLNKLDLRDYLWNMYSIRVKGVRSYIQQQKVRQDRPGAKRPAQRRWFRPRAVKKMMVELEEPFAWREEPESLDSSESLSVVWDKETFDAAKKDNEQLQATLRPDAKTKPSQERVSIAQQAKSLLEGKAKWKGRGSSGAIEEMLWEDVGDAVEVERDVRLPKE